RLPIPPPGQGAHRRPPVRGANCSKPFGDRDSTHPGPAPRPGPRRWARVAGAGLGRTVTPRGRRRSAVIGGRVRRPTSTTRPQWTRARSTSTPTGRRPHRRPLAGRPFTRGRSAGGVLSGAASVAGLLPRRRGWPVPAGGRFGDGAAGL